MEELPYILLYNVFQGSSRVVKEIGNATKDTDVIFKFKLKNPGYKLTVDSLPFQVSFKKVPMLSICLSILVLLLPKLSKLFGFTIFQF
jgi:hypothetical protein